MRKISALFLVLGIASASLSSCSRSNYAFNPNTPAYLGSERVQPVAKATPTLATPELEADASATTKAVAATPAPAPMPAKVVVAAPAPAQVTPVVVAAAPATAVAPVAKAVKPSLVQRVVLNRLSKQIAKIQQFKQATAGTQQTAASKVGRAALVALAGLLLAIIGIAVAGGGLSGGSGAGFAIGIVLYYIGAIAFLVGLVLIVVGLINGN